MKYEVKVKKQKIIQSCVFDLTSERGWVDFISFILRQIEKGLDLSLTRIDKREGGQKQK